MSLEDLKAKIEEANALAKEDGPKNLVKYLVAKDAEEAWQILYDMRDSGDEKLETLFLNCAVFKELQDHVTPVAQKMRAKVAAEKPKEKKVQDEEEKA